MIGIRTYARRVASIQELDGLKVYNERLDKYGYINDDNISNWDRIGSSIFVSKYPDDESGSYWDTEDVVLD